MAKIFSAPKQIVPPNVMSLQLEAECERYESEVRALVMSRQTGKKPNPLVGKVVRFQIADGYAQYMVMEVKPLSLIHLDILDGYRIQPFAERGLNLSDIKAQVKMDEAFEALFDQAK